MDTKCVKSENTFSHIIKNMDWELFRKQKQWLVDCAYSDTTSLKTTDYENEMAEGVLCLMDAIEDIAEAIGLKSR